MVEGVVAAAVAAAAVALEAPAAAAAAATALPVLGPSGEPSGSSTTRHFFEPHPAFCPSAETFASLHSDF
jgi:hypothetical protein